MESLLNSRAPVFLGKCPTLVETFYTCGHILYSVGFPQWSYMVRLGVELFYRMGSYLCLLRSVIARPTKLKGVELHRFTFNPLILNT